jgi:hypothetical protein
MEAKNTNHKTSAGIIVLVLGLILLLNNFDWIQFPVKHYIFSWKTLLIGIGIILIAAREKYVGGAFMIGLGLIFWSPEIFNYQFTLKQIFWPAMMIVFGTVLLLKATVPCNRNHFRRNRHQFCKAESVSFSETKEDQN